ncbi:integrase/recombinase xerD homolog [Saccostrea cucullata]|uniref:integrase/recombinase xerD homolog n=1 Tax=Saccostrea cuccullata TaxID=36930 RepID=UPI002ED3C213
MNSKAENTRKTYGYAFNKFRKWCFTHNISYLPATDFHVSLYLTSLSNTCSSAGTIDEAFYAISWAHKLAGFPNPCSSELTISAREGCHRTIGKQLINKKEPITSNILKQLCALYGGESCSLLDIRICCMCLLSYAGFLRFSELVHLKRSDICFYGNYMTLTIQKSKTDRYKEGSNVVVSCTNEITCPVRITRRYLSLANINDQSNEYLFRSITYCKNSNTYKLRGEKCLSYTRAREILLDALASLGLDRTKFGLHSLRAGGATAAANHGVCDRLFKKHGRWKSETAKDGYVSENLRQQLSVTKNLGI